MEVFMFVFEMFVDIDLGQIWSDVLEGLLPCF